MDHHPADFCSSELVRVLSPGVTWPCMSEESSSPPEDSTPEGVAPEDTPPPPPEAPPVLAAMPVSGQPVGADNKVLAGVLGITVGALGIHKFVLGYTTEGVIMLLISIVAGIITCGISTAVIGVIGLVEGIIYLTKPDDEFVATYVQGRRGWF